MSAFFSTFTEVGLIDARLRNGVISLPLANTIPFRSVTLKDIYGVANQSTITINTQGSDLFEDGTNQKVLNTNFGNLSFYAGTPGRWYLLNGTQIVQSQIGSLSTAQLNVSSITGTALLNFISTPFLNTQLTSTILGLGSAGYISSSQLLSTSLGLQQYISSFIDPSELTSTVIGLGTAGFTSSLGLQTAITSSIIGLGTAGYVSTPTLGLAISSLSTSYALRFGTSSLTTSSFTATFGSISSLQVNEITIGNGVGWVNIGPIQTVALSTQQIQSQIIYTNNLSTTLINGIAPITPTNITSTVIGLGTAGYISSPQLLSTSLGLQQQIALATNTASLTSTVIGLGTAGYISSPQLLSTSLGLQQYISSFIDPSELTSTVIGLGTAGFTSSLGLQTAITSSIIGLGTAGYVSSSQLLSTSLGLQQYISSFIDPSELTSTVIGLGTAGFTSSLGLQTAITSSIIGLGTAGYVSTPTLGLAISSLSTSYALRFGTSSLTTSSFSATIASISSLQVNEITIGNGVGWVNIGPIQTVALSTQQLQAGIAYTTNLSTTLINGDFTVTQSNVVSTVIGLGTAGYVSTSQLLSTSLGLQTQIASATNTGSLTSTVIGLGTAGYVSSSQLLSTSLGLQQFISTFIDPTELTSTVIGLGTAGFTSSLGLQTAITSSIIGLGSAGYISSSQLLSTSLGLQQYISSFIDPSELTSTVIGLGTAGFTSSLGLQTAITSSIIGLGTSGYVSSSQLLSTSLGLQQFISTFIDPSELTSTVIGLGTAGFTSSLGLQTAITSSIIGLGTAGYVSSSQLLSTSLGLRQYISSFIDPSELTSTVIGLGTAGFTSSLGLQTAITSSIIGLGTAGYVSTPTLGLAISSLSTSYALRFGTSSLTTSSFSATIGSISSLQVNEITIGNGVGWVNIGPIQTVALSTQQLQAGIAYTTNLSTTLINGDFPVTQSNIVSTVIGLGTAGYLSSVAQINLGGLVSTSFLDTVLTSTVRGLGTAGYVSTSQLLSTSLGLQTQIASATNTGSLTSTVIGLGTAGYISSAQLLSTSLGLQQFISTFIDPTELTSTVIGLGTAGFTSSLGLQTAITSSIIGLGTAGYISTPQLLSTSLGLQQFISTFIDPTELTSTVIGLGTAGFTSSLGLNRSLTSTVIGLGTAGYISSLSFVTLSTQAFFASTATVSTVNTRFISSGTTTMSSAVLLDPLGANSINYLAVASTFLYFNSYIIGGSRVAQPQWATF